MWTPQSGGWGNKSNSYGSNNSRLARTGPAGAMTTQPPPPDYYGSPQRNRQQPGRLSTPGSKAKSYGRPLRGYGPGQGGQAGQSPQRSPPKRALHTPQKATKATKAASTLPASRWQARRSSTQGPTGGHRQIAMPGAGLPHTRKMNSRGLQGNWQQGRANSAKLSQSGPQSSSGWGQHARDARGGHRGGPQKGQGGQMGNQMSSDGMGASLRWEQGQGQGGRAPRLPARPDAMWSTMPSMPREGRDGSAGKHGPGHHEPPSDRADRTLGSGRQQALRGVDNRAILEVGVADDPNPRFRPTMEDAHVSLHGLGADSVHSRINLPNETNTGYFAVYDGHGGREAVDFIEQQLHQNIDRELKQLPPARALEAAFLQTDAQMSSQRKYQQCGSTVAAALVRPSESREGGRDLFVANVGDARAVLAVAGPNGQLNASRLTRDHNPTTPREIDRVRRAGGMVYNGRVNGMLAVSRALGDHALKDAGVTGLPYQNHVPLGDEHKFMIVACDGLWDVVTDQEAVATVKGMKNSRQMAKRLVDLAMRKGTTDNVSVMAIRLQDEQ